MPFDEMIELQNMEKCMRRSRNCTSWNGKISREAALRDVRNQHKQLFWHFSTLILDVLYTFVEREKALSGSHARQCIFFAPPLALLRPREKLKKKIDYLFFMPHFSPLKKSWWLAY